MSFYESNSIASWLALSLIVLFSFLIILKFATLIANFILFRRIGKNQWFGLVPFLNDYIIFDTFWTYKAFIVNIALYVLSILLSESSSGFCSVLATLMNIAVLLIEVSLMNRISKGFGKGMWYTIGLIIMYPLFIIILALTCEPTDEVKEKIRKSTTKETVDSEAVVLETVDSEIPESEIQNQEEENIKIE